MASMNFELRRLRIALAAVCLGAGLATVGCDQMDPPARPQAQSVELPSDDELCAMIDAAIDFTKTHRTLRTDQNAAWQIMHGVLAYGRAFEVEHDGEQVGALDWVLGGGNLNGWTMRKGARGLKAVLEAGSTTGQGHEDQWLAVISQCDLPSDQPIRVGSEEYSIADLLKQSMYDVYEGKECSWTLIGLSTYLPLETEWKSANGDEWSLERIMKMEAEQDLNTSACGGSHRLIGMTMALDRYRQENPEAELTGGWQAARQRIDWAIERAQELQQPDGSFSVAYFRRPSNSPDLRDHLGATGHTLEFLSLALEKERLKEDWVARSVVRLCKLFEETRDIDLECGALYHAVHGLVLYRERRFGPRQPAEDSAPEAPSASSPEAAEDAPQSDPAAEAAGR